MLATVMSTGANAQRLDQPTPSQVITASYPGQIGIACATEESVDRVMANFDVILRQARSGLPPQVVLSGTTCFTFNADEFDFYPMHSFYNNTLDTLWYAGRIEGVGPWTFLPESDYEKFLGEAV